MKEGRKEGMGGENGETVLDGAVSFFKGEFGGLEGGDAGAAHTGDAKHRACTKG